MNTFIRITAIAVLCLSVGLWLHTYAIGDDEVVASRLVEQLEATIGMYQDDKSTRDALVAIGEAALPAIEDKLCAVETRLGAEPRSSEVGNGVTMGVPPSPDILLINSLLRCAAAINTDNSIALLVRTIGEAPDTQVKRSAIYWLEKRVIRVPFNVDEKAFLMRFIGESDSDSAGIASMVLANCLAIPVSERIAPIVARFITEVQLQPEPEQRARDSYVSLRVLRLNPFLRAFRDAGESAVPYLQSEDTARIDEEEVHKWLILARGMAGDIAVAADLAQVLREDADTSIRVEATRAYARSAKEAAIPLLVELLDDPKEISEHSILPNGYEVRGTMDGFRPVAGTAQAELSRLGRADLWQNHPYWAQR